MKKKYSPRIGVLADDLTGAGDVGVQFADRGLEVLLDIDVDEIKHPPEDAEVWVINTNSRSDVPSKAAKKVRKAAEYLNEWQADYIYKKIDSTLRGPVGAELEALMEVMKVDKIPLCAAFPDMGRITRNGYHYVHGEKLGESPYSRDIESPVKESNINRLLTLQMKGSERVLVKDASGDDDLEKLSRETPGTVFAGAAAWAGKLADTWLTSTRKVKSVALSPGPVLAVSGSLNPVSLDQVRAWAESGLQSVTVNDKGKDIDHEQDLLVKTLTEEGASDAKKLSRLACGLWNSAGWDRVILNGGTTAYSFMVCIKISRVEVVRSLMKGIALIASDSKYFVLKPGGYGQTDTLKELARRLGGR